TGRPPSRWRSGGSSTPALRSADLGEHAERRLADRQLVELGVDAAELLRPALVARLHLDLAERQRRRGHPHRPEAAAPRLGLAPEVEVDLDLVHVLPAADVRVAELLVRVEERAAFVHATGRVDDLVAVHSAAAAFDLVLGAQRELAQARRRLLAHLHSGIVGANARSPQDLTSSGQAG